jgi:hypothetical protein
VILVARPDRPTLLQGLIDDARERWQRALEQWCLDMNNRVVEVGQYAAQSPASDTIIAALTRLRAVPDELRKLVMDLELSTQVLEKLASAQVSLDAYKERETGSLDAVEDYLREAAKILRKLEA